jgi:hypothetical protein
MNYGEKRALETLEFQVSSHNRMKDEMDDCYPGSSHL